MNDLAREVAKRSVRVGVDIGGTFTDAALLDVTNGRLWITKTSSVPEDPSLGFARGTEDSLRLAHVDGAQVERILHGTTVATNLVLEQKGALTALVTTQGFKYVLEIGRHDVPRRENQFAWVKPTRPVLPENIWEVPGRIDYKGQVIEELDEGAVCVAAQEIRDKGILAVAIVLLHSYANPVHERRVAELLRLHHPHAQISLSSEVLPVFREYERSMTTVLNAYVMPAVGSYIERLEHRTKNMNIDAPVLLMKSSGGVASTASMRRTPVETALSGPAAGAVGAAFIGSSAGFADLISIDIGGTSADVALIQHGMPGLTTTGEIGRWRVGLPMVDIVTIGAGGGSIARVTEGGGLSVGPESAGAEPGPVCYRRGGIEPTVTDANLVLGRLTPYLLGGSFSLDLDAARNAIRRHIAEPLGLGVEAAAQGIVDVVDHNMMAAIRQVSVDRGLNPRDLVLLPFGGAGPLHGCSLARAIGCKRTLIPPAPGVLSALGLLTSDLRASFARTCLQRAGGYDLSQVSAVFKELLADAARWFDAERVSTASRCAQLVASLRYKDQSFELDVPWADDQIDEVALTAVLDAFHDKHERLYGFALRDMPVELVTLRVDAIGVMPAVRLEELPERGAASRAIICEQPIAFEHGARQVQVYDRGRLGVGARIEGPAVITQLDSTTFLLPGQTAEVHPLGSLIIDDEMV